MHWGIWLDVGKPKGIKGNVNELGNHIGTTRNMRENQNAKFMRT